MDMSDVTSSPTAAVAEYLIPESNLEHLTQGIAKLNKRAKRLQTAPISLTVLREEIKEKRERTPFTNVELPWDEILGQSYRIVRRRYIVVSVSGEAPKISGWTFVATLQHAGEAGTIIRALPGVELPVQYRKATAEWCDHCKQVRNRKDTYVVRSEAGEYRQVGSNCLRDFLGHQSPETLAKQAEWLGSLSVLISESEDEGYGRSRDEEEYLPSFLAAVAHVVRTIGWKSRTQAKNDGSYDSTVDQVALLAETNGGEAQKQLRRRVGQQIEADAKLAADALAWVREVLSERENLSDYLSNVTIVAATDYVGRRGLGIAGSIIALYQREVEQELRLAEQRKIGATSGHIGTVGKRIKGIAATITGSRSFDTDYGAQTVLTLVDSDGNVLKWFTSASTQALGYYIEGSFGTRWIEYQVGDDVLLTGTVKKHGEYQGVKETAFTRCALTLVTSAEAKAQEELAAEEPVAEVAEEAAPPVAPEADVAGAPQIDLAAGIARAQARLQARLARIATESAFTDADIQEAIRIANAFKALRELAERQQVAA